MAKRSTQTRDEAAHAYGKQGSVDLSRQLLTPNDVARLLCLPPSTIYGLARTGRLPCFRIGRAVRFARDDLESYIAANCRR